MQVFVKLHSRAEILDGYPLYLHMNVYQVIQFSSLVGL